MKSSVNTHIIDWVFLQISLTYVRNNGGTNTFLCSNPEFPLTSSDSCLCLSTLTLCECPKRKSYTHTTTLKSTTVAMIFVSSLSCGIKSKAFGNAYMMWSTFSSNCLQSLHLLSLSVCNIFVTWYLVSNAWCYAAIISLSLYPFKSPLDSHGTVSSSLNSLSILLRYWPCITLFSHFFF
jgi:hypothetical protein